MRDGLFKVAKSRMVSLPPKYTTTKTPALKDNLNRWITWEAKARFNKSVGLYFKVHKDGELVFDLKDTDWASVDKEWPSIPKDTWHLQYGVYGDHILPGPMEIFFDDALVAEKE